MSRGTHGLLSAPALAAIPLALQRTVALLSRPLSFKRWGVLALCLWLSWINLMQAIAPAVGFLDRVQHEAMPATISETPPGAQAAARQTMAFIAAHLPMLLTAALLLGLLLLVLTTYLSCHGVLLLLRGLLPAQRPAAQRVREFFLFRATFALTTWSVLGLLAGVGMALAYPDLHAGGLGPRAATTLAIIGPVLGLLGLAACHIYWAASMLAAPLMLMRHLAFGMAWRVLEQELGGLLSRRLLGMLLTQGGLTLLLLGPAAGIIWLLQPVSVWPVLGSLPLAAGLLPLFIFLRLHAIVFLELAGVARKPSPAAVNLTIRLPERAGRGETP